MPTSSATHVQLFTLLGLAAGLLGCSELRSRPCAFTSAPALLSSETPRRERLVPVVYRYCEPGSGRVLAELEMLYHLTLWDLGGERTLSEERPVLITVGRRVTGFKARGTCSIVSAIDRQPGSGVELYALTIGLSSERFLVAKGNPPAPDRASCFQGCRRNHAAVIGAESN